MPVGPARTGSIQWLTQALNTRGRFTLDAWGADATDDDVSARRLHRSDIVAIPGGNTFALRHHLQRHDLLDALDTFVGGGGCYVSGHR